MTQKIHCDVFDVFGIDWSQVTSEQLDCIISQTYEAELMGSSDELYGFVGVTHIEKVVGGFFVIQFPTELLSYRRDKTATTEKTNPAERVLVVLFLESGKVLLQNRHFQYLPIDMGVAQERVKRVLTHILNSCGVGPLASLVPVSVQVERADLVQAYESSIRVSRLEVTYPDPHQIPEDFVYYNPQRDRNAIIRDSRIHDYPKLRRINLVARRNDDLRDTHIGSDLVHAVTDRRPFVMEFRNQENEQRILRRLTQPKLEFRIDTESQELSKEALLHVIEIVNREAVLGISVRTIDTASAQMSLFDSFEEDSDFDEE